MVTGYQVINFQMMMMTLAQLIFDRNTGIFSTKSGASMVFKPSKPHPHFLSGRILNFADYAPVN